MRVERRVGELVDVHLAEALEPLPPDVLDLAVALGELGGDGVAFGIAERAVVGVADLARVQRRLGGVARGRLRAAAACSGR